MRSVVLRRGPWSLRLRPRAVAVGVACVIVAVTVAGASIGTGDYPMTPGEVIRALTGTAPATDVFIVRELRLPRVAAALLVGAALALAGAVFQSLIRNPLASPDLLGVTQGAATGALTMIVLVGAETAAVASGAVIGGLATGALIYLLAWRHGLHGYRLVLVGIGVAALLTGVNGYLITRANIIEAARAMLWLAGSVDGRGWEDVLPLAVALAVTAPVILLTCARPLHMLEMGDDLAGGLGVRRDLVRLTALVSAVVFSAAAAATAGPVSFVALIAPQVARRLTRAPGPNLLASLCLGAALLVAADFVSQRIVPDRLLPVGVVTGLLGGIYLTWLLRTERKANRL